MSLDSRVFCGEEVETREKIYNRFQLNGLPVITRVRHTLPPPFGFDFRKFSLLPTDQFSNFPEFEPFSSHQPSVISHRICYNLRIFHLIVSPSHVDGHHECPKMTETKLTAVRTALRFRSSFSLHLKACYEWNRRCSIVNPLVVRLDRLQLQPRQQQQQSIGNYTQFVSQPDCIIVVVVDNPEK